MFKRVSIGLLMGLSLLTTAAQAEEVLTTFDTLNEIDLISDINNRVHLNGIEKDTGTPISFRFRSGLGSFKTCIPMVMTMIEKPGRYYLEVRTTDINFSGCRLFLRD